VRFGGNKEMNLSEFERTIETLELAGGALSLDFVNTINSRLHPEHDYLTSYHDLVAWAEKTGVLTADQGRNLRGRVRPDANAADKTLQQARDLRDLLHGIFVSLAHGAEPTPDLLEEFGALYADALANSQLARGDRAYRPVWEVDRMIGGLLWPIIYSAGEILLSGVSVAQIKECPGCGWLFLDTSKNQSRRWCSMNTCGARDKMERYRGKQRGD
jgi:predicted RNA-binding Zn ribbon-like protein